MARILIVEDETIIRSALRRLLERNQYQVSEAGSVQEAQERFTIAEFDLIVSDFSLPGFDGKAALEIARKGAPDIPFIFVTGTMGEEVAIETLKNGATEIPRVRGGLGISIVSTSQGVMSGQEARKKNVGGELLCEIW